MTWSAVANTTTPRSLCWNVWAREFEYMAPKLKPEENTREVSTQRFSFR